MRLFICVVVFCIAGSLHAYKPAEPKGPPPIFLVKGQMPNLASDREGNLHLVYGTGDSILYSISMDKGTTFSSPVLVGRLPLLYASSMRGPQIEANGDQLTIIACNESGNIYTFRKEKTDKWKYAGKVTDAMNNAKEGLMSLSGDDNLIYAVWLDDREKDMKIYGASSHDGGKSWSRNKKIYQSPDKKVCECCKPSVVVHGRSVSVMFRNWVNGNRDMYLIQSADGGNKFGNARKLGDSSWALNGCPMDGGGLALNTAGAVQTVWRRGSTVYACSPGKKEFRLGEGRNCTMENVGGKNVYAWTDKGNVVVLLPGGKKQILGKGILPVLKSVGNGQFVCFWENDKKIYFSTFHS